MTNSFENTELNLFYEEPDPDRWLPCDRFPRRVIRRIIRGKSQPGGQMRVFLNLCAGLDKLGVQYRINDYGYIKSHPGEVACIIGKPFVLNKIRWRNPIVFGAAVYSHPTDDPDLLTRLPIKRILVPGEWMRQMCEPYWGEKVAAWPVGINTDEWKPVSNARKGESECRIGFDVLIYNKVRWDYDLYEEKLIRPIRENLEKRGLNYREIRYGFYREEDFQSLLGQCQAMIFLCEHETQGIAYQQALSSGVPILAWDRGGYWCDPSYYPHKVEFQSVSSVPYWDCRCGVKFKGISDFPERLDEFLHKSRTQDFNPRQYILENLTLEKCAQEYLRLVENA